MRLLILMLYFALSTVPVQAAQKISARQAELLAKSRGTNIELHEKSVPADVWEKMHAQIFQNEETTLMVKEGKVYDLGGGTESFYAGGTGGPKMLTVSDINNDGAPDLVYVDHVVMSGPVYDGLRVFDGKGNVVVQGHVYMNSRLSVTKNPQGQVEVVIDGRKYAVSLGGLPFSKLQLVLTPLKRP